VDEEGQTYEGPPEGAYGRVTNPERYVEVQQAAIQLLDHLEQTYMVRRSESMPDQALIARNRATQVVRLDPEDDRSGPLVCTLTPFPGVRVTLGGGYEQAFPSCGCDACDEAPTEVIDELLRTVELFVQGHLAEGVERDTYSYRIGSKSGTRVLCDDDPRRTLPRFKSWAPWPQR
jgi:hypothetical protein